MLNRSRYTGHTMPCYGVGKFERVRIFGGGSQKGGSDVTGLYIYSTLNIVTVLESINY